MILSRQYLNQLKQMTNIVIYGTGSMSQRVMNILQHHGIVPVAVVDGDSKKIGKHYINRDYDEKIIGYDEMKKRYDDYTILLTVNIDHAVEIKRELMNKGETHPIIQMQCPFKVDDVLYDGEDSDASVIREQFCDDRSKNIFDCFLRYKYTGDALELVKYSDGNSYFDPGIIDPNMAYCYVDEGCFTGDTIADFLLFCNKGYKKIIGVEADPINAKKAQKFIQYGRIDNAVIINRGGGT